jgi:hypothetical protein
MTFRDGSATWPQTGSEGDRRPLLMEAPMRHALVVTAGLAAACALFVSLVLTGCDSKQDLGRTGDGGCVLELTECSGACVNLTDDPSNCGSCGHSCNGGVCAFSQCMMLCPQGTTDCNGACANLGVDPLHCGSCGNACGVDQHCGNTSCFSCGPGTTYCLEQSPAGVYGTCANFANDNLNCGRCQNRCPMTQTCVNGTCQ